MKRTAYTNSEARSSLAPAARTNGTANGTAVDTIGYRSLMVVVVAGTLTDGSQAFTLEDSADGSTGWTAVAAELLQGSLPTLASTDDNAVAEFGARDTRRFVRVVCTTSGATTGGIVGAVVVLAEPRRAPASHSNA